jgi:hypothetical protein
VVLDHARHLGEERIRILDLLAGLLEMQRRRGRTPATDGLRSLLIEEGEAEGLIAELAQAWGPADARVHGETRPRVHRDTIATRADEATACGARLPLWFVRRAFELSDAEYDAVLLTLLVECDARAGRLAAFLNDRVDRSRPTVGLVQSLAELQGIDADTLAWRDRPIFADGLLKLEGDGPLPERGLRIDHRQAQRLATLDPGHEPTLLVEAPEPGLLDRLVLPDALRQAVRLWVERVAAGGAPPLVVATGPEGSGRSTLIHAASSALGRPLVAPAGEVHDLPATLRLLRREARWYGAHLSAAPAASDGADPADFWRHLGLPPGLVFVDLPESQLQRFLAAAPFEPEVWRLAEPGPAARAELWQKLMPPGLTLTEEDSQALAGAFRVGPAVIARAVRRADAERGTRPLDRPLLAAAARQQVGQGLAGLADRLAPVYPREDLVVPEDTAREIDLALAWMRHQTVVLDHWGLGRRVTDGRGLTVLFAGPPGTGKTMAAQVLARELELDCFRIDLSRVVSKFIGETEQNLARLFDEAEPGGTVLFFDEADALFGKRSEVRDARDRYANIEVGYLLQRMEQYEGVAVLATNRATDMDDAFLRRFQVVARFRLPVPEERRRIWARLLPDNVADDVDVGAIAQAVELSGGEIKNCVLAASDLAASEGGPVASRHVVRAVRRELAKSGRLADEAVLAGLA